MTQRTTVKQILDRMHAIHVEALTGWTCQRYFPRNPKVAEMPIITAIPTRATYDVTTYGNPVVNTVRTFAVLAWFWNWELGQPTQTALEKSEALIDEIAMMYLRRPRLELTINGLAQPLDGIVNRVLLLDDSGITGDPRNIADVRFNIQVSIEQTIYPLGDFDDAD